MSISYHRYRPFSSLNSLQFVYEHIYKIQYEIALSIGTEPSDFGVLGKRPSIASHPRSLGQLQVASSRNRTCAVTGGTSDDTAAILDAFNSCNNGGQAILDKDTTYTIGTALDLRFLQHVDWGMYCILKIFRIILS
jgi:hypothetical protein